jgi:hypothetical protein
VTDKELLELLELAAKAAGYQVDQRVSLHTWKESRRLALRTRSLNALHPQGGHTLWNADEDDGDALRLAVKIGVNPSRCMQIVIDGEIGRCGVRHTDRGGKYDALEEYGGDPYAATRRAIVLAAAMIGEAKTT